MDSKISVLMGVYNCANTLEQAVKSIQDQTYSNWELILCDDGSTDDTYNVAMRLAKEDARIVLIKNEKNCGLNITLNRCLQLATGKYIARMDGDDDCLPERFEKQLLFLKENPAFQITSSPMILFDEEGEWGRTTAKQYPQPEDIVSGSPICHAPVMLHKKCMDTVGGYTESDRVLRVEDVDLWIKLYAAGFRCYNIQEPLYCMRNDKDALSRRKYIYRVNSVYVRLRGCRVLNLSPKYYCLSLKPMLIGLIPAKIRYMIRKWI